MTGQIKHPSEPEAYGAKASDAELIVYGIHGRGQSPEFIRELADRIGQLGRFRWVMPAAPGNSWYPESFFAPTTKNQPSLKDALQTIDTHLSELLDHNAPIVTLGFSQGACLLAEFLLRTRKPVDGIVLHTGGYLGPHSQTFSSEPDFLGTPAVVLTAREDAWVPLYRSEETAEALRGAGADVTVEIYEDKEHHINDAAIESIRSLLERVAETNGKTSLRKRAEQ